MMKTWYAATVIGILLASASTVSAADPASKSIIDTLAAQGWSLRQALSGPSKPATIGYESTQGEQFWSTNFALIYLDQHPLELAKDVFFTQFAVEGDLGGSSSQTRNDYLKFNGSVVNLHSFDTNTLNGVYSRLGPVYEATKDFSIQNAYGELEIVPVYQPLAIGVYRPIWAGVELQMLPSIIIDGGSNMRRDPTAFEEDTTVLRVIPYGALSLSFPTFAKSLGLHSTALSVTDKVTYLPLEQTKYNNFASADVDFGLTEYAHLVVSYSRGRQAPTYLDTPDFSIKFGLMFGKGNLIELGPE